MITERLFPSKERAFSNLLRKFDGQSGQLLLVHTKEVVERSDGTLAQKHTRFLGVVGRAGVYRDTGNRSRVMTGFFTQVEDTGEAQRVMGDIQIKEPIEILLGYGEIQKWLISHPHAPIIWPKLVSAILRPSA